MASGAPFASSARGRGGRDAPAFVLAALVSAGLLLWAVGDRLFAGAFLAGLIGIGGLLFLAGWALVVVAGTGLAS